MPRIPTISIDEMSDEIRPLVVDMQRRSLYSRGLLNIHAQMAHSPAVFAVYAGIRQALERFSTLDFKTRTAILLTTSVANDARYPMAIQLHLAQRAGWTFAEIDAMCAEAFDSDPSLAALLRLVRQAVRETGHVDDANWDAATAAGWTSAQLAEAFANMVLGIMVDAFARFAEPELDVPAFHASESGTAEAAD